MCSANQGTFMVRPVHATSVSAGTSSAASATSFSVAMFRCKAAHKSVSFMARNERLTFLEPARGNRLAGQVRAQHPGEFFGVAGLMDDDVADRPGFTPAAGVGAALLDGV